MFIFHFKIDSCQKCKWRNTNPVEILKKTFYSMVQILPVPFISCATLGKLLTCLNFFICKMGMVIPPISQGCFRLSAQHSAWYVVSIPDKANHLPFQYQVFIILLQIFFLSDLGELLILVLIHPYAQQILKILLLRNI